MNDILTTTEDALVNFAYSASVSASLNDVTIYPGLNNTEMEFPAIICSAESFREVDRTHGMGQWIVKADVIILQAAADTPLTDKGRISGVIKAAFMDDNTITNLQNAITNYKVYDIFTLDNINTTEGDYWVQTLSLDIVCALTN